MCSVSNYVEIISRHFGLWGRLGLAEKKGKGTGNELAQSFLPDLRQEAGFFLDKDGFILLK